MQYKNLQIIKDIDHNHVPDIGKIEAAKVNSMKSIAMQNIELSTHAVISLASI